MHSASLLVAVLLLVSGCSIGPTFRRPVGPEPATWSTSDARFDAASSVDTAWWEGFDEPRLTSLVERSARHNHDVRQAEARLRAARAIRKANFGALLPSAGASAGYTRSELSERSPITGRLVESGLAGREFESWDAGFDARWEIDVFGGRRRAVERAEALEERAAHGLEDVRLSIAAEVARTYIELRGLQAQIAVVERNLDLQTRTLHLTENRQRAGLAPKVDVTRARTQVETTRASLPALRASARSSIYRLSVLVGEPPATLLDELRTPAPIPSGRDLVPIGIPSELVERRPDVRQAEKTLAASVASVGVATAELYPKFFLTGLAGFQSISADDLFSSAARTWSVGPTIRWRLFEGGRLRAEIEAAEAGEEASLAHFEQAVLLALEEVERALVALESEKVEYDTLLEAAENARTSVRLARVLYDKGLRDLLTVLDAERQLAEVDRELTRSETELGTRLVVLYKALGGGWEDLRS